MFAGGIVFFDCCLYALQSAIPLLPAKQRGNHPADWMETDARVICPVLNVIPTFSK